MVVGLITELVTPVDRRIDDAVGLGLRVLLNVLQLIVDQLPWMCVLDIEPLGLLLGRVAAEVVELR
jgi:hypothetical protein